MKNFMKSAIGWIFIFLLVFGVAAYFGSVAIGIAVAVLSIIGLILIKVMIRTRNNSSI